MLKSAAAIATGTHSTGGHCMLGVGAAVGDVVVLLGQAGAAAAAEGGAEALHTKADLSRKIAPTPIEHTYNSWKSIVGSIKLLVFYECM